MSLRIWALLFVLCDIFSSVALSVFDGDSFLRRDLAHEKYDQALEELLAGRSIDATIHMLQSYSLYPTSSVAKKLSWLYDMLGDVAASAHWQQQYVRKANITQIQWLNEGIRQHYAEEYSAALRYYNTLLDADASNVDALYHKGVTYQHLGDIQQAAECYFNSIQLDPFHTKAILNLAALHQKYGSYQDAVTYYEKGLDVFAKLGHQQSNRQNSEKYFHPHHSMVQYNLGLAYMQLNQLDKAYDVTRTLLTRLQEIELRLHSPRGDDDTPPAYAYTYDAWEVSQSIGGALGSLSKIQRAALHWARWEELHEQLVAHTLRGIAHSRAHYCESVTTSAEPDCTPEDYGKNKIKVHFMGPLLPFDTLMMPMPLSTRLEIATATSLAYKYIPYVPLVLGGQLTGLQDTQLLHGSSQRRRLRLGFMSFDFNDHPTAHLIEAVFQIITAAQRGAARASEWNNSLTGSLFHGVELIVFSYGRNDGSRYRKSLEHLAHKFVNIVEMSFEEGAAAIRAEEVDVLLDLQIHTLGSRLEITASGVAPTVVNYLVYPGTSGARFYEYLVADEVVVPVEHAPHYSEALLLLPPTYQVSSYDEYEIPLEREIFTIAEERGSWRRLKLGLPEHADAFIFCNFNKINKIDPESLTLWMQVLRSVPNSYLWLIEPSDAGGSNLSSKTALLRSVAAAGVAPERILFAPRASKADHILRHAAADLFLDTVVYGAHSTATDALRGSLPVLTLRGDSFPSRVAASLYASFIYSRDDCESDASVETACTCALVMNDLLVVDSAKEFVDAAVRLSRRRVPGANLSSRFDWVNRHNEAQSPKRCLFSLIENRAGLFNATRNVETFIRGMEVVQEVRHHRSARGRRYHAVIR